MRHNYIIRLLLLIICTAALGKIQAQNIFLDRSFWKSNPSIAAIEQKIKEGNDPAELNEYNFNATVYAIIGGMSSEAIIYLLKQKGNDIDVITHDGRTYLHWAAMGGQVDLMKYLVENGIKTGAVDDHGYTEITFAATTGQQNAAVYDFLLANGSKITDTNHDGANALLLLIPHLKDFTMVDYLTSKGLELDSNDNDGNGAFYYAAKTGNIDMMDKLIKKGIAYKENNKVGGNAMIAAGQGTRYGPNSLAVFQHLEKLGIDPNVTTHEGVTPLHLLAGRTKDTSVLTYFIGKGVDINQADNDGNTPLMNAARGNELEVVKYIAEKTKNINAANESGNTALSHAIARNNYEVVDYLISKGADVQVKDKEGNSLACYLMESYRRGQEDQFEKKLNLLKAKGLDMKAIQAKGKTLFHLAVEANDLYLVKKAKDNAADVNKANDAGATPLQIAAMKASDDVILKYLLEIGANKNVVTDFDETVFDLAQENEQLKKKGVDIQFLK
ncbi:ankyrin repeat domain-containing protein [Fulvivirga ulvae]|uniref:ankyrin repeat domain-containing protein n=1 Tax=Fulvivirga ulvae TaxID=2904245 RepID=UPI001F3913B8|nr:ankyrin repeat domain-containing protein [Fulvivirga ulvae]UII33578.1 ankyrin repeat domain-containing protein [Fulvivirga ulvae]